MFITATACDEIHRLGILASDSCLIIPKHGRTCPNTHQQCFGNSPSRAQRSILPYLLSTQHHNSKKMSPYVMKYIATSHRLFLFSVIMSKVGEQFLDRFSRGAILLFYKAPRRNRPEIPKSHHSRLIKININFSLYISIYTIFEFLFKKRFFFVL